MKASLAVVFVALSSLPAVAADPPKVAVEFVIEAARYKDNLTKEGELTRTDKLKEVQDAMAAIARESLQGIERFRFLPWVIGESTKSKLRMRLVAKQAGSLGVDYYLIFEGYLGNQLIGGAPEERLFKWNEEKVTDGAGLVKSSLGGRIKTRLADSALQERINTYFVANVPLADSVNVDSSRKKVFVPLNPKTLNTSEHSILRVDFIDNQREGFMKLSDPAASSDGVVCGIIRFRHDPTDVEGRNLWPPSIPTNPRITRVTMLEYKFAPYVDVSGSSATTPCAGGDSCE